MCYLILHKAWNKKRPFTLYTDQYSNIYFELYVIQTFKHFILRECKLLKYVIQIYGQLYFKGLQYFTSLIITISLLHNSNSQYKLFVNSLDNIFLNLVRVFNN